MEMFLMVLSLSLLGVAVSAGLFAAATKEERRQEAVLARLRNPELDEERFFVRPPAGVRADGLPKQVPIEVLLLQIERHVRLELAAAESFHQFPTSESLHMQTLSPLVH
jgi:hypothetical protein